MAGLEGKLRCLLLLSSYPANLSLNNFKVAYGPSLEHVLRNISRNQNPQGRVLDIAIQCPLTPEPDYNITQHVIGLAYRLICSLSVSLSIDIQFSNEIDCQVYLFHQPVGSEGNLDRDDVHKFPDLVQFSQASFPWVQVYYPESESGEELFRTFLRGWNTVTSRSRPSLEAKRVPGGLTMVFERSGELDTKRQGTFVWPSHSSVAVGGTFDHLHVGHKLLLSMTALLLRSAEKADKADRCLTIGITGDQLLKNKKYAEELEDWQTRQARVQSFLLDFLTSLSPGNALTGSSVLSNDPSKGRATLDRLQSGIRINYVEIFDPFGPTITDPAITALIISRETRSGGQAVNEKRTEQGWQPLEVFEVDVLGESEDEDPTSSEDFRGKISSTEIRSRLHHNRVTTRERAPK